MFPRKLVFMLEGGAAPFGSSSSLFGSAVSFLTVFHCGCLVPGSSEPFLESSRQDSVALKPKYATDVS